MIYLEYKGIESAPDQCLFYRYFSRKTCELLTPKVVTMLLVAICLIFMFDLFGAETNHKIQTMDYTGKLPLSSREPQILRQLCNKMKNKPVIAGKM